jgi:hypothetical protein
MQKRSGIDADFTETVLSFCEITTDNSRGQFLLLSTLQEIISNL